MANVIPIVFCFDSRIILGASVAIKSLIDCAKDTTTYDIRIFHSNLTLKHQKNLSILTEGTRHNLAFHYINEKIFSGAPHNNGSWTELVYYRLLIPEILNEYDKVIYSDVDVLFKGDLADIYSVNLENYELAAVPVEANNKESLICHTYFPENRNDKIYISSFLIFNSCLMRKEHTVQKFFNTIKTFNNRLKFYDLDTLNITCDKFYPISFKYGTFQSVMYDSDIHNAQEYEFLKTVYTDDEILNAKENTVMIHYAGKLGKPWRMKQPYSDYQEYIDKLPSELKVYTFRDLRKKFFNKR